VSIILADKKDVLRVPNAALRLRIQDPALSAAAPKGPGVWMLDNKKPRRVPLQLGIRDGRFTEVLSGDISINSPLIVEVKNDSKTSASTPSPGPGFLR
jgi:HlyD family secretion protein